MDDDAYKKYLDLEFDYPFCLPPEITRDLYHYHSFGGRAKSYKKCSNVKPWSHDVWSLGLILCEIVSGFPNSQGAKSILEPKCESLQLKIGRGLVAVSGLPDLDGKQSDSDHDDSSDGHTDCKGRCDLRVLF